MKSLFKISMTLILILLIVACATTSIQIPEKYMLDNQLKRVSEVADIRVRQAPAFTTFEESFEDPAAVIARRDTITFSESKNEWIKVDEQSFLLRSGPSTFYLLILHLPAIGIMSTDTLSFQLASNIIKAKSDYLELNGGKYIIERIYKIENTQQMQTIVNQLVNPNKTEKKGAQ